MERKDETVDGGWFHTIYPNASQYASPSPAAAHSFPGGTMTTNTRANAPDATDQTLKLLRKKLSEAALAARHYLDLTIKPSTVAVRKTGDVT